MVVACNYAAKHLIVCGIILHPLLPFSTCVYDIQKSIHGDAIYQTFGKNYLCLNDAKLGGNVLRVYYASPQANIFFGKIVSIMLFELQAFPLKHRSHFLNERFVVRPRLVDFHDQAPCLNDIEFWITELLEKIYFPLPFSQVRETVISPNILVGSDFKLDRWFKAEAMQDCFLRSFQLFADRTLEVTEIYVDEIKTLSDILFDGCIRISDVVVAIKTRTTVVAAYFYLCIRILLSCVADKSHVLFCRPVVHITARVIHLVLRGYEHQGFAIKMRIPECSLDNLRTHGTDCQADGFFCDSLQG